MPINRKNKTVIKRELVEADTDMINSIFIDFENKAARVILSHGNLNDNVFETVFQDEHIITNISKKEDFYNENLEIKNNKIELTYEPTNKGIRIECNSKFVFMGSDWTIDGKVITFKKIKNNSMASVRYRCYIEEKNDFDSLMAVSVVGDEILEKVIEKAIVDKLIGYGVIDGTII